MDILMMIILWTALVNQIWVLFFKNRDLDEIHPQILITLLLLWTYLLIESTKSIMS